MESRFSMDLDFSDSRFGSNSLIPDLLVNWQLVKICVLNVLSKINNPLSSDNYYYHPLRKRPISIITQLIKHRQTSPKIKEQRCNF